MKKDYRTPEIEIQAIELSYLLEGTQITQPIGDGEVEPGTPNLSRTSHESPYQESSFQAEDDWDM